MRLTAKQEHVLRVLDGGEYTTSAWHAWYPLRTTQIGGIITRLYTRGLVEPVGWRGNSRVWAISGLGRDVLRARDKQKEEK